MSMLQKDTNRNGKVVNTLLFCAVYQTLYEEKVPCLKSQAVGIRIAAMLQPIQPELCRSFRPNAISQLFFNTTLIRQTLASCDFFFFYLFPKINTALKGKRFRGADEIKHNNADGEFTNIIFRSVLKKWQER